MHLVANALAALEAFESLAGAAGGAAVLVRNMRAALGRRVRDSPSAADFLTGVGATAHGHFHGFLGSLGAWDIG